MILDYADNSGEAGIKGLQLQPQPATYCEEVPGCLPPDSYTRSLD